MPGYESHRRRDEPGVNSERQAWREVAGVGRLLATPELHTKQELRNMAAQLTQLAREMTAQLDRGVHANPRGRKNPALALIVPNPPRASDWSDRVYAIQYKHKQDGDDYEHEFERGVCLRANTDGSVTLYRRDGRPVWEEFPG